MSPEIYDKVLAVFISHSGKDAEIAGRLANLLISTLGMSNTDIRCSSVEGFEFSGGDILHHEIRREAINAKVFLGLITKNSLDSRYVQFELGARWGAEKKLTPILGPGCTREILKDGPLADYLPVQLGTSPIIRLLEDIQAATNHSLKSTSYITSQVNEFVRYCIETDKSSNESKQVVSSEESIYLPDEDILLVSSEYSLDKTKKLSDRAVKMLISAAEAERNTIAVLKSNYGIRYIAGKNEYGKPSDDRSQAKAKAAFDELYNAGFIEGIAPGGDVYKLTQKGYDFYDNIIDDIATIEVDCDFTELEKKYLELVVNKGPLKHVDLGDMGLLSGNQGSDCQEELPYKELQKMKHAMASLSEKRLIEIETLPKKSNKIIAQQQSIVYKATIEGINIVDSPDWCN